MQAQGRLLLVGVRIDVIETVGVESRCPADDTVYLVPLAEQKLGEIGAVLPCDAGDERFGGLMVGCDQRYRSVEFCFIDSAWRWYVTNPSMRSRRLALLHK